MQAPLGIRLPYVRIGLKAITRELLSSDRNDSRAPVTSRHCRRSSGLAAVVAMASAKGFQLPARTTSLGLPQQALCRPSLLHSSSRRFPCIPHIADKGTAAV